MSLPALQPPHGQIAAFIERHEPLRSLRTWLVELLGEPESEDTSIAWEDGEEHDEDDVPV